jgi:hypothetical protein
MQYKTARDAGQFGRCSNVPIVCPMKDCGMTLWKYNAVAHIAGIHGDGGEACAVPTESWVQIRISKLEESKMGIKTESTHSYRRRNHIPSSSVDGPSIPQTRARALTASSTLSTSSDAHVSKRPRTLRVAIEQHEEYNDDFEDYEDQIRRVVESDDSDS